MPVHTSAVSILPTWAPSRKTFVCIVQGANALQAMRWSDGSYLEDQDHWWLSGIHRDVFLLAKPLTFISDYHVKTPLTFAAKGSSRLASARQACCMCLHCAYKQHILPRHKWPANLDPAVLPDLLQCLCIRSSSFLGVHVWVTYCDTLTY